MFTYIYVNNVKLAVSTIKIQNGEKINLSTTEIKNRTNNVLHLKKLFDKYKENKSEINYKQITNWVDDKKLNITEISHIEQLCEKCINGLCNKHLGTYWKNDFTINLPNIKWGVIIGLKFL